MKSNEVKVAGISRFRMETDGPGIRTLVYLSRCPLMCKYCLNAPLRSGHIGTPYTPERLLEEVKRDDVYFRASSGGVTFGGGEPAYRSSFIEHFRSICPSHWTIAIETSLNVLPEHMERLAPCIDNWIIDIKDMDGETYRKYTGVSNARVLSNLGYLAEHVPKERVLVRIPHIPDFNTPSDVERSVKAVEEMGFRTEVFSYETDLGGTSGCASSGFIIRDPDLVGQLVDPDAVTEDQPKDKKIIWSMIQRDLEALPGIIDFNLDEGNDSEWTEWD